MLQVHRAPWIDLNSQWKVYHDWLKLASYPDRMALGETDAKDIKRVTEDVGLLDDLLAIVLFLLLHESPLTPSLGPLRNQEDIG